MNLPTLVFSRSVRSGRMPGSSANRKAEPGFPSLRANAARSTELEPLSICLALSARARSPAASTPEGAASRQGPQGNALTALPPMSMASPSLQAVESLTVARLCGAQMVRFEGSLRQRAGGARAPRLFAVPQHMGSCAAARIHTSSSSTAFEPYARPRAHL